MVKVFIQHEYDLIEELEAIINNTTGSYESGYYRHKKEIQKIISVIKKSIDVMISK